jgi:Flp pilus assembly secretin CpaC
MALICVRRGPAFGRLHASALALGILVAAAPSPAPAADIDVVVDQAKTVRLPERVSTLVIGNPLIADVSLQAGNLMVVTGKGFGMTNIIALDRAGTALMEKSIEVRGPRANIVVVYRGMERESYSCTPFCERRITLGDSGPYFESVIGQTVVRNGLAAGGVPAAK